MSLYLLAASGLCVVLYLSTIPWLLCGAIFFAFLYACVSFYTGSGTMSARRKLMVASWSAPAEGNVMGCLYINADPLKRFLDAAKASGDRLTVTTVVAKAAALAFRYAQGLNMRLVNDVFVPNKTIDVSCLAMLDGGRDLSLVKLAEADTKPLKALTAELTAKAEQLRAGKNAEDKKSKDLLKLMPVFVIRPLINLTGWLASALALDIPALGVRACPGGTCMITSVGSMGVSTAFAPFTPFLRVPLLLTVGGIEKKPAVVTDEKTGEEKIVVQNQLCITATIDHRYADGAEIARLGNHLKRLLENPDIIDSPDATPDLPTKGGHSVSASPADVAGAGAGSKKKE